MNEEKMNERDKIIIFMEGLSLGFLKEINLQHLSYGRRKARNIMLDKFLNELVFDFMNQTKSNLTTTPISELLNWSGQQKQNPTSLG